MGLRQPLCQIASSSLMAAERRPREHNCFTETCSGSEAGSHSRLIDFVYHSTLGLRVIHKKKKKVPDVVFMRTQSQSSHMSSRARA